MRENEKVLLNILVRAEERKAYEKGKTKRAVLPAHPSARMGALRQRAGGPHRAEKRVAYVPNRAQQALPESRGCACLPSDFRDSSLSDVPPRLYPG